MEERQAPAGQHKLILNNRSKVSLNGITDILSFDVNEILIETELGMLMIRGKDLHVNRLTLEKGEVDISGKWILCNIPIWRKGTTGENPSLAVCLSNGLRRNHPAGTAVPFGGGPGSRTFALL